MHFLKEEIEKIYKEQYGKILATLMSRLGNLDGAEDALHEAFKIALVKWSSDGIPKNPYAWLVSVARNKAIDVLRRDARQLDISLLNATSEADEVTESEDDQLKLIFYCCHPMVPLDARVALSLKEVCGLTIEEIAKAYLSSYETIKKRIGRAKKIFRNEHIPFELPTQEQLPLRLSAILQVIYLIYNEGYAASSGHQRVRSDLTDEAIFLSRRLNQLLAHSESRGLLAMMLFHESRKETRLSDNGDIIPLELQDRSKWDKGLISEAQYHLYQVVASGKLGYYSLQAAIASVHALSESMEKTDWGLLVSYYQLLLNVSKTPVIEMNYAIAIGMHKGAQNGLEKLRDLDKDEKIVNTASFHAAKGEFLARLGRNNEALEAYQQSLDCAPQEAECRYITQKMEEIKK